METTLSTMPATLAAACARSLQAAVRSLAMARAESSTQRECIVASCVEQVLAAVREAGDLVLTCRDDGLGLAGNDLPATPETRSFHAMLRRSGLRVLRLTTGIDEPELREVLQLVADPIASLDPRSYLDLWQRSLTAKLPHVQLSCQSTATRVSPRGAATAPGDTESRDVTEDICLALLEDLETCPPGAPYRERAVALCGTLVTQVVTEGRLDKLVVILDALSARSLADAERSTLLVGLAPLRGELGAAEILRRTARHPLPTLVALVRRLGAGTVRDLLASALDAEAPPAAPLLKALVGTDPGLFVAALGGDHEIVQERALRLLQRARHAVPAANLEELALSASPPLRARALECLADQYPTRFLAQRALALLEDASEEVRGVALRRLAELRDPATREPLQTWLNEHAATIGQGERAAAEQALAPLAS